MSLLDDTYGSGEREFNFRRNTARTFFYISVQAMESVQHGSSPTATVRLDIVFVVPPEASKCRGGPRKQTVALVKANRVYAEPNFVCNDANLYYFGPSVEATPWSIAQSQVLI